MATEMRVATCGDCIHADICKQLNGSWFSRDNPAYCKGFKDRANYAEVVRCKDCRMFEENTEARTRHCRRELGYMYATPDGFCSYGRRRTE